MPDIDNTQSGVWAERLAGSWIRVSDKERRRASTRRTGKAR